MKRHGFVAVCSLIGVMAVEFPTASAKSGTPTVRRADAAFVRAQAAASFAQDFGRLVQLLGPWAPSWAREIRLPPHTDPQAPLNIVAHRGGVLLFGFHVVDADAFADWMTRRAVDHWRHQGLELHVLQTNFPALACLQLGDVAWCQLGAGSNGVQPLIARSGEPIRPSEDGSSWQLQLDGESARRWYRDWSTNRLRASAALLNPDVRSRRLESTLKRVERFGRWLELSRTFRLKRMPGHLRAEFTLPMNVQAELHRSLAPRHMDPRLVGWSEAPALASLHSRFRPLFLTRWSRLLARFDLRIPEPDGEGGFAAASFGVDPYCRWSRKRRAPEVDDPTLALSFAFTSAIVIPTAQSSTTSIRRRAQAGDAPLEVVSTDGMVLLGLGTGAGPAALRRLHTTRPREAPSDLVLSGKVDLAALRAALQGASLSSHHRPELRWLMEVQRLPWVRSTRSARIWVRRTGERQLTADLHVR
ncbi:MAG: hypothetical protein ACFB9M_16565 [Myxococcota bacterium]